MYKYILGTLLALVLSGCSHFAINGMMCDQIAADPFSTTAHGLQSVKSKQPAPATRPPPPHTEPGFPQSVVV